VLAITGFIAAFVIPVAAVVLGLIAQSQIRRTGEEGRGLARAAVIIGIVGCCAQAVFFVVWASLFFSALSQIPFDQIPQR
jgi:hypothetical protein